MISTRKDEPITPGMHRASEAESTLGDEVREVIEDIMTTKSIAVKSPRQQLTPRRLLHSPLSAKASPRVDSKGEASNEAIAYAVNVTPPLVQKKPTPKRTRSTPKKLGGSPIMDIPLDSFRKRKKPNAKQ